MSRNIEFSRLAEVRNGGRGVILTAVQPTLGLRQ
jgi:hypothetical protein